MTVQVESEIEDLARIQITMFAGNVREAGDAAGWSLGERGLQLPGSLIAWLVAVSVMPWH